MSKWDDFDMETRIIDILDTVPDEHHFRRPFLTAYQIAIEYADRYPEDFSRMEMKIGGKHLGTNSSLARYIAHELSQRIATLDNIEGAFISNRHIVDFRFEAPNGTMVENSCDYIADYGPSMYRLIHADNHN